MHSHMYFYATDGRPDWSAEVVESDGARLRRRAIADALLAAVSNMHEVHVPGSDEPFIGLHLSPRDYLEVEADNVHWDIKYRSVAEQECDGTMPALRIVAAVLQEVAGFDFFESGCQGLNERGDIELMSAVLSGSLDPLRLGW